MEYYLRYIEASDDGDCTCRPPRPPCARRCESRKHIIPLLDCALPRLDEGSNTPFAEYEKRRDKMFFSRKQIQTYFGKPAVINNLLSCRCHPCKQARETTSKLDERERLRIIERSQDGRILFAIMVYLRKLHFVYAWFDSSERERDLGHAISHLHRHGTFNSFMKDDMEQRLFKEACDQAFEMFNPARLSFSLSEPPRRYAHSQRFPFRDVKRIQEGNFGTISKFEIFEEYCDPLVETRMGGYNRSVIGHGNQRTRLFAMKSVKIPDRDHLALAEQEVLRMVSNIESSAAENIITLLTCYTWRNEMHFVFPYVQTDLYQLLRKEPVNDMSTWFNDQALPENKLWKEMVGVAFALSVIHTGLTNPFEGVHGRVFACHFDLKPSNILVTADGKLKIGDFGLSNIQIVAPQGKPQVRYRGGDLKYAPPESRLSLGQTETWFQPHGDETAPALKYDVWSLACIMTEVLIYLLNHQTPGEAPTENPLVRFDSRLGQRAHDEFNGRFFDQRGVKECVTTTIEAFRHRFSPESPDSQYMSKIIDLLFGMFKDDNHERISSQDVVDGLYEAETAYRASLDTDDLASLIGKHSAPADDGFKEVGWVPALSGNRSEEPISFDKMNDITVEIVCQHTQKPDSRKPCRIRLFRKQMRGELMPTFFMYWAVKGKDKAIVDKKIVTFPEWAFKPTYLFQKHPEDEQQFECALFPANERIRDRAFIFSFQSTSDVRAFQGALLQKKVSSLEFSGATVEVKTYRSKDSESFKPASVQFWTVENPILLPDNRGRRESGSIHSIATTTASPEETMVILSPEKSLLQLDCTPNPPAGRQQIANHGIVSDGSKKFDLDEDENVIIFPRGRRQHFPAVKSESCHPWQPGEENAEWRIFTTPAIRMDEANGVKSEKISVTVKLEEAEEQLNKIWSATSSTPGNWDDLGG